VALVTVALAQIASVTSRSRLLRLAAPVGFEFEPGQAVVIGAHGQQERKPYSIACSPEQTIESGLVDLLVGTERDGRLGSHLPVTIAGTLIDMEGPIGSFTLPPLISHSRVLLVAGGTGIAPLRSMLDHMLRRRSAIQVSLLYSARREDEFAFIDELQAHAAAGRLELHQTVTRDHSPTWSGRRGRIGESHFEAVLHKPAETLCLVCGPDRLVAESVATLKKMGVQAASIRTEQWAR
jgi:NAD(P)H-flavin reductase